MADGGEPTSCWFFTREQLESSPSRRCGVEADKELSYRQQAANLIQDMGQRLNVSQLTINTAIVYMHRFYMHHSFTKFHRNIMSPTALFLAAKVEEQPRKLEHVIKVSHACLNPPDQLLDTKSDAYLQQAQELVILETILLQTLGFEITIEHPHTDVVKCTQLVRASKDLAQTSYFMATNSLHLTTFCLQYKPTVIACVCIHLACKWSNWEIPVSTDGKHWWEYVDQSVTLELLDELTHEFLQILEKTPSRLKRIRNWRANQAARKPKSDGQLDNSLLSSSLVQNSILVDPVASIAANASFPKASTSAFPAPVALNSGSLPIQTAHNPEDMAILSTAITSSSYSIASHHEWPQHQEQTRTEQVYSQKPDTALPVAQYNLNYQPGTAVQLHSGLHHRPDKAEHSLVKPEHGHKSSSGKHHGQMYSQSLAISHKMSLDKYREKRKLETVELDARDPYAPAHLEQAPHKKHTQTASGSLTSPIKMKLPLTSTEKAEKHLSEKKEKGVSLKLRIPIPPTERSSTKEDLKMKIKVASTDRHSSSDEGSGKSKHSSPHMNKEPKEKHKDHSSNRHHSSSHKHSHSHGFSSGNSNNSNKLNMDGMPTSVLRSPVGLSNDGSNSSSSRKRPHSNDASYNHHSKMSKSSKSSGSSSSSSSVKQYISSHNAVLNHPLPPPPPVTYQVGYGHLSTLVKLDKKPVENNGPDAGHEYSANSQHMDYKDTFDMLDSLLSAQGMNM
ncbi:cyclin-T2 isoform X2 [Bombina bombina]|uniref:cyclin-T2 isoform X2 n=1 Tax=Bombina bombina TaxID=8345 RepID=UPI00235A970F|nr:cyclin-T2 isoform X2 [Bombina bombina]